MANDDLLRVWQDQPVENAPMPLEEIRRKARQFESTIRNRNRREYLAALALKPDAADVHNDLGVVLEQLGKREEAKEQYEKAVALKDDYADAHANLAHVVIAAHVQEGASSQWVKYGLVHLQRALALNPAQFVALADWGVVLASEGKFDEARAKLEASLGAKPDQPEAKAP